MHANTFLNFPSNDPMLASSRIDRSEMPLSSSYLASWSLSSIRRRRFTHANIVQATWPFGGLQPVLHAAASHLAANGEKIDHTWGKKDM
jgi:hypothetical protein